MAHIDLQNRSPKVERLPDYRQRVTRLYDVENNVPQTPAEILANAWLAWGTADVTYTDCLLIKQDMQGQDGPFEEPCKEPPVLIRVYEQIHPSLETPVGNADVLIDQAGNKTVTQSYLQFSTGTAIYGIPGVTAAPAPNSTCLLKSDERTDDGTLRRIKRTFINSGLLSQSDEIKNNGSLLIRTLTYINQVPPTPAGYVLFSQKVDYPNGLPVYTYSFAKGSGILSSLTEYRRSVDSGVTGVIITTIKYLSASSVGSNPITPPGGSVVLETGYEDSDGYRIWTGQYGNGTGTVDSSIDYKNNGKLVIYSITALNTPPSAPSPTIGGTVVLIKSSRRNSPRLEEGAVVYDYTWAEGNGLISNIISIREDGLREQTYVSLAVKQTPTGTVILDESEEEDGLTKYTVRCMQSAAGGDPTGATLTLQRNVPFTYPGRAKPYSTAIGSGTLIDVYLDPPVEASIPGTITITYQTSSALSGIGTRWQPVGWAAMIAKFIVFGGTASSKIQGLRGYRAVNDGSSVSVTTPSVSYGPTFFNTCSCVGEPVYGNTTATITVYGGPPAPDGNTYVLEASTELAFVDVSGTKYYRQTVITATIPAQPALPV